MKKEPTKRITLDEYREAKNIMLEYENQIRHAGRLLTRYRNRKRKEYNKIIIGVK